MQDFRQLDVWRRAHALSLDVQRAARAFPRGHGDLRAQLIRAVDSIPSNIVEGCGAATNKEFARFLDMSIKSAFEVDYRLELAHEYELISSTTWQDLTAEVVEIRKMTYRLRQAVLARDADPPKPKRRPRKPKPPRRDSSDESEP